MRISQSLIYNRRQEARRQKGLPGLVHAAGGPEGLMKHMLDQGDEISLTTARNWATGRSKPQRRLWDSIYKVAGTLGVDIILEPPEESALCGVPGCRRKRSGQLCATHRKRVSTHGDPLSSVPIGELGERSRLISEERAEAMRKMRSEGKTYTQVAEAFGVSKQRAFQICNPTPLAEAG
jgi:hypothetical protein